MRLQVAALALVVSSCTAPSAQPAPRYVYYLHGQIVEDEGPRGVSPRWGQVDYFGIIEALSAAGLEPISEVRPKGTEPVAYAGRIAAQIRRQIAEGVPASHITVVGASKGAVIATLVSTRLAEPELRYVFIANCNNWLARTYQPQFSGQVLSIYEASDEIGQSCRPIADASPDIARFAEVRLETGLGHGIIYRPLEEWMGPTIAWARGDSRR